MTWRRDCNRCLVIAPRTQGAFLEQSNCGHCIRRCLAKGRINNNTTFTSARNMRARSLGGRGWAARTTNHQARQSLKQRSWTTGLPIGRKYRTTGVQWSISCLDILSASRGNGRLRHGNKEAQAEASSHSVYCSCSRVSSKSLRLGTPVVGVQVSEPFAQHVTYQSCSFLGTLPSRPVATGRSRRAFSWQVAKVTFRYVGSDSMRGRKQLCYCLGSSARVPMPSSPSCNMHESGLTSPALDGSSSCRCVMIDHTGIENVFGAEPKPNTEVKSALGTCNRICFVSPQKQNTSEVDSGTMSIPMRGK
jgi:hypothetical protein